MRDRNISKKSLILSVLILTSYGSAQTTQPASGSATRPTPGAKDYSKSSVVVRMMKFDTRHDGKLTPDEITDARLMPLFKQADSNGDGVVTQQELEALAAKLDVPGGDDNGPGGFGGPGGPPPFGPPGGFDDRGGPPGGGPDGRNGPRRGPGGRGGPGFPQPGQILSPGLIDALQLTADQKKQIDALQAQVNAKLAEILTPEQAKQVAQPRQRNGPPRP